MEEGSKPGIKSWSLGRKINIFLAVDALVLTVYLALKIIGNSAWGSKGINYSLNARFGSYLYKTA